MAKTVVTLADGGTVTIEETPEQIVIRIPRPQLASKRMRPRDRQPSVDTGRNTSTRGPVGRIRVLKNTGFFKNKRTIGDVQSKLEEAGHIYQLPAISPVLIRLVRAHELRRFKEAGAWKYVNP